MLLSDILVTKTNESSLTKNKTKTKSF